MESWNNGNVTDNREIGRRIRNRRKELGLTLEMLARSAGISPAFLGNLERGHRVASVETLARLSKALDTDMHYIVFGYFSGSEGDSELRRELKKLIEKYIT